MSQTVKTALVAAVVVVLLCCIASASCAQAVNMLFVNTPREPLSISEAALAGLVPPGYANTDKIAVQLDGVGPRELAVVMCTDNGTQTGDLCLRYSGP